MHPDSWNVACTDLHIQWKLPHPGKMGQMELRWLCCPALTLCQHQLQALVAPVGASSMTQNPRIWTGVGWKGPLKAA